MSRRRFAIINMAFGYVNTALSIVIGLILIPLYLEKIGARMYGYWLATGGVIYWLGMLDMGVGNLVGQRVAAAYAAKDKVSLGHYYVAGWVIQLALVTALSAVAFIFAWLAPRIVGVQGNDAQILTRCAFLAGLCLGVQFLVNAQAGTLNGLQRPLVKFAGQCASALVTICGTYYFLLKDIGLYAIPGALLIGSLVNLSIIGSHAFTLVRKSGAPLTVDRATLREMTSLASRGFTATSASALAGRIEPTIITLLMGPVFAVNFSTTRRAAELLGTVMSMLTGSTSAGLTNMYASGEHHRMKKILGDLLTLIITASMIFAVAYTAMNQSFVTLWIGETYFVGTGTTVVLAVAMLFGSLSAFFVSVLGALGDFRYAYRLTAAEGLLRLVLMTVLLASFGHLVLVALAAAITSLVICFLAARRFISTWGIIFSVDRSSQLTLTITATLLAIAGCISHMRVCPNWTAFFAVGTGVAGVTAGALWIVSARIRIVVMENVELGRRFFRL